MGEALGRARGEGGTHVVFGDLFLAEIRAYREAQLAPLGLTPVFPLWQCSRTRCSTAGSPRG
jgi:diphthamide synthase (EF-2-diphthine--ammonia ligase)